MLFPKIKIHLIYQTFGYGFDVEGLEQGDVLDALSTRKCSIHWCLTTLIRCG